MTIQRKILCLAAALVVGVCPWAMGQASDRQVFEGVHDPQARTEIATREVERARDAVEKVTLRPPTGERAPLVAMQSELRKAEKALALGLPRMAYRAARRARTLATQVIDSEAGQ
jgi:hypothetical protein